MTTEKMAIHKALAELKTMDDRIAKAIRETPYVLAVKHSAEKINGMTVDNFKIEIVTNAFTGSDTSTFVNTSEGISW